MLWLYILAFLVGFVTDILYVGWFWASENHRAWTGGIISAIMYAIGIFAVVAVVHQTQFAVPLILGYGLGSVVGIKWKKWKETNDK